MDAQIKQRIDQMSAREKTTLVCLYYARLASNDPKYKGVHTILRELSEKYRMKKSLLKNDKDTFDALYDNGRQGWKNRPLERRGHIFVDISNEFGNIDIDDLEKYKDAVMEEVRTESDLFFSIRTKDKETVDKILNNEKNITISGLNILKDDIQLDDSVFIVLGGDKPAWETGLIGLGKIVKLPYDLGYDPNKKKNFRVDIDVELLLNKPIKRGDLILYKDTFDIIGIGPMTKWEPNQAISHIDAKKAIALLRAMIEISPNSEPDLRNVFDNTILERIKGSVSKFVEYEVDLGETINSPMAVHESTDEYKIGYESVFNIDSEEVLNDFVMDHEPLEVFQHFINSDKNIILIGPPGTGKTTIAEIVSEKAVEQNYIAGCLVTTAISDWTTFDTIGGYMPNIDGELVFKEGVFLKCIRENRWLIIDEINRADIDKAFGHFFTVLSGKDIEIPYSVKTDNGIADTIKVQHSDEAGSYYDEKTTTYHVGKNWRIIATMNTYDKNSLFMMSFAFMRRFAQIHIPVPTDEQFFELIDSRGFVYEKVNDLMKDLVRKTPRKLGTAIIIDLMNYIEESKGNNIAHGLCSLVISQYEGISLGEIKKLYSNFAIYLSEKDKVIYRDYIAEFFDVSKAVLTTDKLYD